MIRALVSGVLHADPQVRTSQTGNSFTTAKLRADDGKGGSVWCNLIAFGPEGERLATLKAGAALSVAGRADLSAWINREGEPKAGLSLVVEELVTLRGKPKPRSAERNTSRFDPATNQGGHAHAAAPFDDLDDWQP